MISKIKEKQLAINLRKEGKTYREILSVVSVAKSTLSFWLKEVGLSTAQKQRITEVKLAAAKRGGRIKYQQRIERSAAIIEKAKKEIGMLTARELLLIGTAIYWGEGTKEKSYRPGTGIHFINMDPKMVIVFLTWLVETCEISKDMIAFETCLHDTHAYRVKEIQQYWAMVTGFPIACFGVIRYKKHSLSSTKRKNVSDQCYYGSLLIKVRNSSRLVRQAAGWVEGIVEAVKK
jgi:hypothetical protein